MSWLANQTPASGRSGSVLAAATPRARPTPRGHSDSVRVLSMYSEAPAGEVVLEDFERFAIARLRVLKGIEDAKSRGKKPEELHTIILDLVAKHLKGPTLADDRWLDQVSHFVLRLAHCRGEELRKWFLSQEGDLFAARFREEPGKAAFLKEAGFPYEPLPREAVAPGVHAPGSSAAAQAAALQRSLVAVAQSRGDQSAATAIQRGDMDFFLVPFEDVPDLVRRRQVLLVKGQAYVGRDQVASLLVPHFRAGVSRGLAKTARNWSKVAGPAEQGRLAPLVDSLATRYLGPDFGEAAAGAGGGEAVRAADVPKLAQQSFPLCMALMTQHLHADRHLKHGGRMQLNLFLKGIGLPMEEALHFWRQEFAPKTTPEAFGKEYAYGFRHNYGKEGARKDYTPYSCVKMITATVGVGDKHGCPYKTLDPESLRAALGRLRVTGAAAEEAVRQARGGHYQLACGSAFAGAHGGCHCDTGINHPNQYYQESRKLLKAEGEKGVPAVPATPAAAAPQGRPAGSPSPLPAAAR
mmetsp:Transcript_14981/g.45214  ORF Transcript_14981/g.45214 Transcript_14981/m.45214 type:complete len:523 (-) Transcript_14981:151-1719(-)|eukprot:CAMPEP_0206150186 /NCGR_PEP_ID=MMETSP1473-20131121/38168_1 /ASSEMBLY_ACC=CAM_ASM_001109 /TAXON_ID=1461547 /ORGANISM="Stichococcus sp, Strain RCC1054" /LENGTH=522 /DNA_ID=CAMNT_0053547679 /DNA_START=554 /DNA_END=2122 /DNA_ORIENTATION=+